MTERVTIPCGRGNLNIIECHDGAYVGVEIDGAMMTVRLEAATDLLTVSAVLNGIAKRRLRRR